GYYRIQYVFKATGTGNNAEIEKRYISLTSAVLGNAVKGENGWYIPQGTARGDVEGFTENKTDNKTETLGYYTRALDPQTDANAVYHNYELHGNNGRLQMTAATGIKLTKKLTAVEPGAENESFTLNVAFSVPDGATATVPGTVKVSFDGKNYQEVALTNNTVSVVLKANEYAYIYGNLAGLKYTITETQANNSEYVPVKATLTGSDAITANTIVNVDFVNKPKEAKELVITKTVTDPFGDKDATAEQRFDVTVTLVPGNITMDWSKVAITHSNETDGNKNVDSTNNKITFTIAHGESVVIKGIPEGVEYTVTEAETEGDGFALEAGTHTGTITDDDISIVNLVNKYAPSPVSPVNIFVTGEKNLYGRDWNVDDEFTFAIQYWTNTGWVQVKPEGVTADETATINDNEFNLSNYIQNFQFTEPGIYTFWVYEEEDDIGGVTYDTTHRSFSVEVIDDWSGELKINSVTTTDGRVTITPTGDESEKVYTVDTDFTNRYAPEGSASVEFAVEKAVNGNGYNGTLENFRFVLEQYQDESTWEDGQGGTQVGEYVITDASGHDKFTLVFDASLLEKEYVSDQINSLNEESGEGEGANGEPAGGEGEENSGTVILAEENKEIAKYKDTVLYYTLKEIEPENDIPGMNCTDDYYRIKVTLSDNGVGGVAITTEVDTANGGETGSVSDAAIDNNGSINVRFTNDYVLKPTAITFEGEKVIDGREFLDSDDFVFELYDAPNFTVSGDPIQTVSVSTIDGSDRTKGSFNFAEITYDQNDIGTHYYVVKEKTGNLPGMTYSEEVYNITVTVGIKKDDAGAETDELEATYTITKVGGSAEDDSIVFTNKYEADEAEISVTKKWSGDTESRRPAIGSSDIAFELQYKAPGATGWETFAGEGLVTVDESITDNDDGTWTVSYILNYPKGTFGGYEFRVVETKIPANYTASNNGEEFTGGIAKDGGTITNTYKTPYNPTPKTSLTIKKVWDDKNDKYEVRPDSVQVRIYANGERYTDVVLSENNGWSYTVRNLPKYEGGKRVEYTAVEINVPKYYSASYSTSSGSVVITNTYGDEPRNPSTGAPVFEAFFADKVSSSAYLPKKREDED
ncbi:MAG: Cna B-type domain-containing protein, partial [Ruminococcaceae bacterium]|nr:Cna B-type domain-containing protein [Oscillospiraceae bacterium]